MLNSNSLRAFQQYRCRGKCRCFVHFWGKVVTDQIHKYGSILNCWTSDILLTVFCRRQWPLTSLANWNYMLFPIKARRMYSWCKWLCLSHMRLSTVSDRAFPVAGSRLWNSLPHDVTSAPTLTVFRNRLKTYLLPFLPIISYLTVFAF